MLNSLLSLYHFQVRIFKFLTGKLVKVMDESLKNVSELQQVDFCFTCVIQ